MADPLGLIQNVGGAKPIGQGPAAPKGPEETGAPSFKDVLMQNIEQVNRLQQDAEVAIEDLVSGKRDDMDAVLIAKQKADIAFQTLLQVRNKMMDAYEEVKQIRV
ncbi:flagellar hook-basal body complex protein FliE [Poriferisphaera sp. WC338]|uniref:flagellar hook-basal body complex protein FliE n=1 Tax=Poriferisphaera sp. WC338 TaxID=3425129 RepID=UPI003D818246